MNSLACMNNDEVKYLIERVIVRHINIKVKDKIQIRNPVLLHR